MTKRGETRHSNHKVVEQLSHDPHEGAEPRRASVTSFCARMCRRTLRRPIRPSKERCADVYPEPSVPVAKAGRSKDAAGVSLWTEAERPCLTRSTTGGAVCHLPCTNSKSEGGINEAKETRLFKLGLTKDYPLTLWIIAHRPAPHGHEPRRVRRHLRRVRGAEAAERSDQGLARAGLRRSFARAPRRLACTAIEQGTERRRLSIF